MPGARGGQERARYPGTEAVDGCEPCGCWEWNCDPREKQPVILTAEPSLQPVSSIFVPCALEDGHC